MTRKLTNAKNLRHCKHRHAIGFKFLLCTEAVSIMALFISCGFIQKADDNVPAIVQADPTAKIHSASATSTDEPLPAVSASPTEVPSPTPFPGTNYIPLSDEEKTRLVNLKNPIIDGFIPRDLVNANNLIGDVADFRKEDTLIQYEVGLHLKELFNAAHSEGIGRYHVCDSYRSQEYQWSLWNNKKANVPNYGNDPYNHPVGIMPGNKSEHCFGLAVDVCSVSHPKLDVAFSTTEEYKWLQENAHRFGFIIRYTADKTNITGVMAEPWHLRYVGVNLALEMHGTNLCLEEIIAIKENDSIVSKNENLAAKL